MKKALGPPYACIMDEYLIMTWMVLKDTLLFYNREKIRTFECATSNQSEIENKGDICSSNHCLALNIMVW
jgi:hypothetical protein